MISILFEDSNLIVVDKPTGLATIPERLDAKAPCLLQELEAQLGIKLWVIHRLDKETSGLILFAKNAETHRFWNLQFENRMVKKTYLAWVHGVLKETGTIAKPLREFGSGRMGEDAVKGKPSVTHWKVMGNLNDFTLLELRPETGRRHQLRVHLYLLGHPIVGDPLYGPPELRKGWGRLRLHAKSLYLEQGSDKIQFQWDCSVPEDFSIPDSSKGN